MRKTGSDPQKTRERILACATAQFAARGYEGARVDTIARRCGLAKNMLYHYFGSKEGLFIAVLERMYETLRARQRDFAIRGSDPAEAMRQLVAHTFSALLEHSEAIALLNNENLHKGRHARRSKRIRALYDPLVDTIREVLRRGAAQGIFRRRHRPGDALSVAVVARLPLHFEPIHAECGVRHRLHHQGAPQGLARPHHRDDPHLLPKRGRRGPAACRGGKAMTIRCSSNRPRPGD